MSNSKSATFINATPHQINLIDAEGNTHTFPASHNPVRLVQIKQEDDKNGWKGVVGGFKARVSPANEGDIFSATEWENLPPKQDNVFHIVSLPCFMQAAKQGITWLVGFDPELTVREKSSEDGKQGKAIAQGGLLFVKKP